MVLTPSMMMPLGTVAPDFTLPDAVSGKMISLSKIKGELGTLVMFICNHCPYVVHLQSALGQLSQDYLNSGIAIVAINANDIIEYPADSPEKMTAFAQQNGFQFPYLFDETQAVAQAYQAACTPDFFLFDSELKCVYRGQFDDSRPGNDKPVTAHDLRAALQALIHHQAIDSHQQPSMGCNIKWKKP